MNLAVDSRVNVMHVEMNDLRFVARVIMWVMENGRQEYCEGVEQNMKLRRHED